jgi:transposase
VFTLNKTDKTTNNKGMKLKENQYRRIEKLLPKQRRNVKIDNRVFLGAIVYRCKNGCSWRDLPKDF